MTVCRKEKRPKGGREVRKGKNGTSRRERGGKRRTNRLELCFTQREEGSVEILVEGVFGSLSPWHRILKVVVEVEWKERVMVEGLGDTPPVLPFFL